MSRGRSHNVEVPPKGRPGTEADMERMMLPDPGVDPAQYGNLSGSRLLVYSHDTLGLGHLRRSLKIARNLIAMIPGMSIRVVTGSPQVFRFEFPAGVDYVQLPPVRKAGPEKYESRDSNLTFENVLKQRKALLFKSVEDFKPHIVLVDHAPVGMGNELVESLEWHAANCPDSIRILGLRDIVDDPDAVVELWSRKQIYETINRLYEHVLVYGSPTVFDPVGSYRFPQELRVKTRFCNYIADPVENGSGTIGSETNSGNRPLVVVTIGGGDGAADEVIGNYLEMLRCHKGDVNWDSRVLTGPFLTDDQFERLRSLSSGLPLRFERFVNSMRPLMLTADLVIATGGYNTVTEILAYAKRSIVIPRIMYRMEQMIRGKRLEEMGLVSLLHPDEVTPEIMFSAVTAQLASKETALEDARRGNVVRFDGAVRLAGFVGDLLSRRGEMKERTNG